MTDQATAHSGVRGLFSLGGYLGRRAFTARWIVVAALWLGSLVLWLGFKPGTIPGVRAFLFANLLVMTWVYTCMQVQRLRDAGRSRWWMALGYVPYLAILYGIVLCAVPTRPAARAVEVRSVSFGSRGAIAKGLSDSRPTRERLPSA